MGRVASRLGKLMKIVGGHIRHPFLVPLELTMGVEYSYELFCKESMTIFFLGVPSVFLHTGMQNCSVGTNNRYSNSHLMESPPWERSGVRTVWAHRA